MARNSSVAEKPASLPATEPEPTEAEQAEVRALAKRKKARRRAPRFAVHQQEGGPTQIAPAGVHADAAAARVMNAFGITNTELAERLMMQIITATHLQSSNEPAEEKNLNAALAAVTGIAPQDEAEAMLAAQMVGLHWLAMDLLRKANDRARLNEAGNMAVKLLRTFATHLEMLKRYRSAGEQRVVVQHQHVSVTTDQAAVQVNGGADPAPGGREAVSETEEQSHAPAKPAPLAYEPGTSLQCPDPARNAVPVADGAGESPLPDARRH